MKKLLVLFVLLFLSVSFINAKNINYGLIELNGSVNPVSADFIKKSIEESNNNNDKFIILTIDTPGGLVDSMRKIIKAIYASKIPVITYTYPKGAQAASAGGFIMISGHISAMSPGTNIGAMHPVSPMLNFDKDGNEKKNGVMEKKVLNDIVAYGKSIAKDRNKNEEWTERAIREAISTGYFEAKKLNVIDLVAEDIDDLLKKINGITIKIDNEKNIIINTSNIKEKRYEMNGSDLFLNYLANPNLVFILFIVAIAGIGIEFKNPGMIFPGVIGGISLVLFLLSIKILPINILGLILLVLAIVLFVLEISIPSYGMLTIGGIISFVLGAVILFDSPLKGFSVSWFVIIPSVLILMGLILIILKSIVETFKKKVTTGAKGLEGEIGKAFDDFKQGKGKVYFHGEYWNAVSEDDIKKGDSIEITEIKGMTAFVKKNN